ncbi:MAG: hypothetical protein WBM13_10590 [Bacteroidia bacterium]
MVKKYLFLVKIVVFISFVVFLGACNLFNPTEPIPSYISIDKIDLTTDPISQGSDSHKITDAWVYVDEQLVGCYELPCKFPVLFTGVHNVMIRAGIKVNGIAAIRSPYPFYTSYKQTVDLQAGVVTPMSPTVTYASTADFQFMEDFELAGVIIDTSSTSDTTLQRIYDSNVFEGNSSGVAYLDHQNTFFECVSSQPYTLPKGGSDVFLEFNYKSNHEFVVGVIAQPPYYLKTASLTYNASANWNKTYLYLTPAISGSAGALQFKIFIGMQNTTGADGVALYLDNIKVVH